MDWISYLRQFRIGEFAIFDFTASFLGMWLLSPFLSGLCKKFGYLVPKRNWVILTLPLSVLAHVLFGRITPLAKYFLDPTGSYITKFVIIGCLFLSLTGIKRLPLRNVTK